MHMFVRQIGGLFESVLLENRPGFVLILFKGNGAKNLFKNEPGGHRYQRCPPTEKKGRIHTSTITVAVLDPEVKNKVKLNPYDLDIKTARGSGPGGQNRNKIESCVTIVHKPTGLSAKVDLKSQHQSKEIAMQILTAKVANVKSGQTQKKRDQIRKNQVGSGMRGDKIRTYRYQNDRVTDHRTGQTWNLSQWMKGNW